MLSSQFLQGCEDSPEGKGEGREEGGRQPLSRERGFYKEGTWAPEGQVWWTGAYEAMSLKN